MEELRFNGHNGHSRILRMPEGQEITAPLMWVDDLKLLHLQRNKRQSYESEEAFHRRIIELQGPPQATYFARSDDHEGLYVGVQYYRAADPDEAPDQRIPVDSPKILKFSNTYAADSDPKRLIARCQPKDAVDYIQTRDNCGRLAVVQYYKMRQA